MTSAADRQPEIRLNNGAGLPALGFDFALTREEVAAIDGLDTDVRGGPNRDEIDFRKLDRPIPE